MANSRRTEEKIFGRKFLEGFPVESKRSHYHELENRNQYRVNIDAFRATHMYNMRVLKVHKILAGE